MIAVPPGRVVRLDAGLQLALGDVLQAQIDRQLERRARRRRARSTRVSRRLRCASTLRPARCPAWPLIVVVVRRLDARRARRCRRRRTRARARPVRAADSSAALSSMSAMPAQLQRRDARGLLGRDAARACADVTRTCPGAVEASRRGPPAPRPCSRRAPRTAPRRSSPGPSPATDRRRSRRASTEYASICAVAIDDVAAQRPA